MSQPNLPKNEKELGDAISLGTFADAATAPPDPPPTKVQAPRPAPVPRPAPAVRAPPAPKAPKDNPAAMAQAAARCAGLLEIADRHGKAGAMVHLKPKATMSLQDLLELERAAESALYADMAAGSMDAAYLAIIDAIERNRTGVWNVFQYDVDGITALASTPQAQQRRALHLDVLQNRYRGAAGILSGPWIALTLETAGLVVQTNALNAEKRSTQ